MRILVVSQYFWPEQFIINELVSSLVDQGHTVDVLTGLPNYPGGAFFKGYRWNTPLFEVWKGSNIYRSPVFPRGKSGAIRLSLNYLSFAVFASLRALFVLHRNYDVSFVFGGSPVTSALPAIVLKWLGRVPFAFWVLDLWPESVSATGFVKSKWLLSIIGIISKFIYRQAPKVLVASEGFRASLEKMGIPPEKIEYFPNGVDRVFEKPATQLDPLIVKKLPARPQDGIRIVFAGNIGVAQDFPTILSALEILKNEGQGKRVQLVVLGDGSVRSQIEKQCDSLNLTDMIYFLGQFPVELMPAFFKLADAMLVTLKRDPIFALTVPAKIQTYMACSRPIIAGLDGEGSRIILQAGAGFSCSSEDAKALAECIRKMLSKTESQREEMGVNGFRYYERNFGREKLVQQLNSTFLSLSK